MPDTPDDHAKGWVRLWWGSYFVLLVVVAWLMWHVTR